MASRHEVPLALKQAAQTVGASRGRAAQLRREFGRSMVPMVIVDNERRHVEVNAAARLLARMSLRELRQLRIDDLTAESDLPGLHTAWEELFERGTLDDRYLVTFKDGSTLSLFYTAIANALPGQHLIVFVPADWPGDELEELRPATEPDSASRLSPRQVEVLRLVALGASVPQIANELSISEATVRTHVKHILERLSARNRPHAVALALGDGVLGDYNRAGLVGSGSRQGGSDQVELDGKRARGRHGQ
jgi:DNA-binding CsgD family transcriptional regulator